MACPDPWARSIFTATLAAVVMGITEWWWRLDPSGDEDASTGVQVALMSLGAIVLVGVFAYFGGNPWSVFAYGSDWERLRGDWLPVAASYEHWWTVVGIVVPADRLIFSPRLYEPCIAWGLAMLALVIIRFRGAFAAPSMAHRVRLPAADRTAMRLLALTVIWGVLATFWHIGLNVWNLHIVVQAAAGAGMAGGAFALLRNWIGHTM